MRVSEGTRMLMRITGRRPRNGIPERLTRKGTHWEGTPEMGEEGWYTASTLGGQTRDTPKEHTRGTQGEHTRDTPGKYAGRVHREGLQSGEGAAAVAVDAEAEGVVEADVTYILGFP